MNAIRRITVAAALAAGCLFAGISARADHLLVPQGIDVPLVFDQAVSSKHAHSGDTVAMHVARDVVSDGHVIISRGTHVNAIVTDVEHRKNFGVNAKLRLAFDPVKSTYGPRIDLQARSAGKSSGSRPDHAAEISGGGALLLGPIGLVGGYFVVGKQVNIKPGEKLMCEVAHDTHLRS